MDRSCEYSVLVWLIDGLACCDQSGKPCSKQHVHGRSPLIVVNDPCNTIKDRQPIRGERWQGSAPSEVELAHAVGSLDSHLFRGVCRRYSLLPIQYEPHQGRYQVANPIAQCIPCRIDCHRSMQLTTGLASMTHPKYRHVRVRLH